MRDAARTPAYVRACEYMYGDHAMQGGLWSCGVLGTAPLGGACLPVVAAEPVVALAMVALQRMKCVGIGGGLCERVWAFDAAWVRWSRNVEQQSHEVWDRLNQPSPQHLQGVQIINDVTTAPRELGDCRDDHARQPGRFLKERTNHERAPARPKRAVAADRCSQAGHGELAAGGCSCLERVHAHTHQPSPCCWAKRAAHWQHAMLW